jgi:hypothetical protein
MLTAGQVDAQLAQARANIEAAIWNALEVVHQSDETVIAKHVVDEDLLTPLADVYQRLGRLGDIGTLADQIHKSHGQH